MSLPVRYSEGQPVLADRDGMVVALADADVTLLADAREEITLVLEEARDARSALDAELKNRVGSSTTTDIGTHLVELVRRRDWDAAATWRALKDLVEANLIQAHEAEACMPEVTTRKPDGRKLTSRTRAEEAREAQRRTPSPPRVPTTPGYAP